MGQLATLVTLVSTSERNVTYSIILDLTPSLSIVDDVSIDSLLLTILGERLEIKVDDTKFGIGTMFVPIHNGQTKVLVEVVKQDVLGLSPLRRGTVTRSRVSTS